MPRIDVVPRYVSGREQRYSLPLLSTSMLSPMKRKASRIALTALSVLTTVCASHSVEEKSMRKVSAEQAKLVVCSLSVVVVGAGAAQILNPGPTRLTTTCCFSAADCYAAGTPGYCDPHPLCNLMGAVGGCYS